MYRKHLIPIGFFISLIFFTIAAHYYPGGSPKDAQAVGYSFTENYISNLLDYQAVNGHANTARPWGIAAVVLMGITTGLAFVYFSGRVRSRKFGSPIKYLGWTLTILSLLVCLPEVHDLMVLLGMVITLLLFFYLTVLLFKTRLTGFKILAVAVLALFYFAAFMYTTRTWIEYLPIMQKLVHLVKMGVVVGLVYLTSQKDFDAVK